MTEFSHTRHFLKQLAIKPHQLVALSPSSSALAERATQFIEPNKGPVIELGAGTGAITEQIIARGLSAKELVINELNPDFCDLLYQRFPKAHIHCGSAAEIESYDVKNAQAVISGLPILSFAAELQRNILTGAFDKMASDGHMILLTHGRIAPIRSSVLNELGLKATSLGREYRNFPPIKVFKLERQQN